MSKSSTSVSIATPLLLIFVVLKLTNNIDWSWTWVLSPIWIPLAIVFTILVLAVFVSAIASNFLD